MSSAILISSGRLIDPFQIEQYTFTVAELIHPVCQLTRYSGQTKEPYTVGEHTFHLINAVPEHLRRAAALHDLNEGLTNDLPRPFKRRLPEYVSFEERVQRHIFKQFNEPWEHMLELAEWDYRICQDEMNQLFEGGFDIGKEPLGITVHCWPSSLVKVKLHIAFEMLGLTNV